MSPIPRKILFSTQHRLSNRTPDGGLRLDGRWAARLGGTYRLFAWAVISVSNLGKQPVGQEMAAWDNVEGFEFQHDLIAPSVDRQATCLSLLSLNTAYAIEHQVPPSLAAQRPSSLSPPSGVRLLRRC